MTSRNALFVLTGLVAGLLLAVQAPLYARKSFQEDAAVASPAKPSLQDALHKPYDFTFDQPTTLDEAARRLTADLGGQVVLDIAALQRLELVKEDEVELVLKGSRLKTGLKLLLDQVGLTYRIVPEDNLMILTDPQGSEDPLDRIWAELTDMHRELHEVQDVLDDLYDLVENTEGGPRLRQPTIIEEMPKPNELDPADPGLEPIPADRLPDLQSPQRPRTQL